MKKLLLIFGTVLLISSCQDNTSYMEEDIPDIINLIGGTNEVSLSRFEGLVVPLGLNVSTISGGCNDISRIKVNNSNSTILHEDSTEYSVNTSYNCEYIPSADSEHGSMHKIASFTNSDFSGALFRKAVSILLH